MVSHDQVFFGNFDHRKAIYLSIFLGMFGAHRFYLKEHWAGASYLLFCWTLIPLVLAAIDAYFLLQMSDEEFEEEFNDVPRIARAHSVG